MSPRFVLVDLGEQTNENWYCVRVLQSQTTWDLFHTKESESLLVELPSGERTWVDYWKNVGGTPE
jgi:hypothetical protein